MLMLVHYMNLDLMLMLVHHIILIILVQGFWVLERLSIRIWTQIRIWTIIWILVLTRKEYKIQIDFNIHNLVDRKLIMDIINIKYLLVQVLQVIYLLLIENHKIILYIHPHLLLIFNLINIYIYLLCHSLILYLNLNLSLSVYLLNK